MLFIGSVFGPNWGSSLSPFCFAGEKLPEAQEQFAAEDAPGTPNVLADSTVSKLIGVELDEEANQQANQALAIALDSDNNKHIAWSANKNRDHGFFMPTEEFIAMDALTCRSFRLEASIGDQHIDPKTIHVCRTNVGTWMVLNHAEYMQYRTQ